MSHLADDLQPADLTCAPKVAALASAAVLGGACTVRLLASAQAGAKSLAVSLQSAGLTADVALRVWQAKAVRVELAPRFPSVLKRVFRSDEVTAACSHTLCAPTRAMLTCALVSTVCAQSAMGTAYKWQAVFLSCRCIT